jgi:NDP-sugar pyrophosphorylase family protein
MLNIVIPMAGLGSRFAAAGYSVPKPLIPINGVPMIQLVINNLRPKEPHRFIFICLKSHLQNYQLAPILLLSAGASCEIIALDGPTEGAACSVLAARTLIDSNDNQLMIANCDQWVDLSIDNYLYKVKNSGHDGLIMTMHASDPKWSFVYTDDQGFVKRVVEKEVISTEATVGVYNFKSGKEFVSSADAMIAKNLRVNGEFYVAPIYNILIENGKRIGVYNVGRVGNGVYGLGTPEDYEAFLKMPVLARALGS